MSPQYVNLDARYLVELARESAAGTAARLLSIAERLERIDALNREVMAKKMREGEK